MNISKGTKCILSNLGHYNFFYMSDKIVEFNCDCVVEPKPYVNTGASNYVAVQTLAKNIGVHEVESEDQDTIIVWIQT